MIRHLWPIRRTRERDVLQLESGALRALQPSGWQDHAVDASLLGSTASQEAWQERAERIVTAAFADRRSRRTLVVLLRRPLAVAKRVAFVPGDSVNDVTQRVREAPDRYFIGLGANARVADAVAASNGDVWTAGFQGDIVDLALRLGDACGYRRTLVVPELALHWHSDVQCATEANGDTNAPSRAMIDSWTPVFVAPGPAGGSVLGASALVARVGIAAMCLLTGYAVSAGLSRVEDARLLRREKRTIARWERMAAQTTADLMEIDGSRRFFAVEPLLPVVNDIAQTLVEIGELQSLDVTDSSFRLAMTSEHATEIPQRLRELSWVRDAHLVGAVTHDPASGLDRATVVGRRVQRAAPRRSP